MALGGVAAGGSAVVVDASAEAAGVAAPEAAESGFSASPLGAAAAAAGASVPFEAGADGDAAASAGAAGAAAAAGAGDGAGAAAGLCRSAKAAENSSSGVWVVSVMVGFYPSVRLMSRSANEKLAKQPFIGKRFALNLREISQLASPQLGVQPAEPQPQELLERVQARFLPAYPDPFEQFHLHLPARCSPRRYSR